MRLPAFIRSSRLGREVGLLHRWSGPWHWYLFHRRSLIPGRNPLEDGLPWLTYGAIDWLDRFIAPEMDVLEWGSGGSTVYFLRRARSLVSIEHDPAWYEKVRKALVQMGLNAAEYRLVTPGRADQTARVPRGPSQPVAAGGSTDAADPPLRSAPYGSAFPGCQALSFHDYVHAAEVGTRRSFDLILVDGRARVDCLRVAVGLLRHGGALVLDNSERERYQPGCARIPPSWHRLDFPGTCPYNWENSQTTVWARPSDADPDTARFEDTAGPGTVGD